MANESNRISVTVRHNYKINVIVEIAKVEDAKALTLGSKHTFDDDAKRILRQPSGGPPGYKALKWHTAMIKRKWFYKIRLEDYKIIGGLIINAKNEQVIELVRIFISPEYQNCGIGQRVMSHIEALFPDAEKWVLDTPKASERNCYFYEKQGYQKVKEKGALVYYEKRMQKSDKG